MWVKVGGTLFILFNAHHHSSSMSQCVFSSKVVQKAQTCRYDWHQTSSQVVVAFYAKACIPEMSSVEANPTNVSFYLGVILYGVSYLFKLRIFLYMYVHIS